MKVWSLKYKLLVSLVVLLGGGATLAAAGEPFGWEDPSQISPRGMVVHSPAAATRAGRLVFTFETREGDRNRLWINANGGGYRRTLTGGRAILETGGETSLTPSPAWNQKGNQLSIVYIDYLENHFVLREVVSTDGGLTFTKPRTIVKSGNRVLAMPQLFFSGDRFVLFYLEGAGDSRFGIRFTSRKDGEDDWRPPRSVGGLTSGQGVLGHFFPAISVRGGRLDIVFQKKSRRFNGTDELFHFYSTNNGSSFSSPRRVTSNDFNDFAPSLIRRGDNLYLAYQANKSVIWDIFFQRYWDGDWSEPEALTNGRSQSYHPAVYMDEKRGIHVAWYDYKRGGTQSQIIDLDLRKRSAGKKSAASAGDAVAPDAEPGETWVNPLSVAARSPRALRLGKRPGIYYLVGNRLSGRLYLQWQDVTAPAPEIYQAKQKLISSDGNVTFYWKTADDASGLAGYAMQITPAPDTEPEEVNLSPSAKSYQARKLDSGRYFFHLRAVDRAGNFSKTSRREFFVDGADPVRPEVSSSTHDAEIPAPGDKVEISFSAVDDIGIDYYRYALSSNAGTRLNQTTKKNKLTFYNHPAGKFYFRVQAVDIAGKKSAIRVLPLAISSGLGNQKAPAPEIVLPTLPADEETYRSRRISIGLKSKLEETIDGYSIYIGTTEESAPEKINWQKGNIRYYFPTSGNWFVSARVRYSVSGWSAASVRALSVEVPARRYYRPKKSPAIALDSGEQDSLRPGDKKDTWENPPGSGRLTLRVAPPDPGNPADYEGFVYTVAPRRTDPGKDKSKLVEDRTEVLELGEGTWFVGLRAYTTSDGWSPVVFRKITVRAAKLEPREATGPLSALWKKNKVAVLAAGSGLMTAGLGLTISFKARLVFELRRLFWRWF